MIRSWCVGLALTAFGCGGDGEPPVGTAAELVEALANAEPGDTVKIGSGRFTGEFEVQSGVDVRGAGRGSTILVGEEGKNALTVLEGDGASQISDLTVETGYNSFSPDVRPSACDAEGQPEGCLVYCDVDGLPDGCVAEWIDPETAEIGIFMVSSGRVTLERVDVDLAYGLAIGAQGLESLTLHDVIVVGRVTEGNAEREPSSANTLNTSAYGVVAIETSRVTVDELDVSGFGVTAVQFVDSETTWTGGTVSTNLAASVFVSGGTATLESVQIRAMLQGFSLIPPYGLVFANGAVVETTGVSVQGSGAGQSIGLLQDASWSAHHTLSVVDNGGIGVQVQRSTGSVEAPAFLLEEGENDLSGNSGVGLAVVESSGIVVRDAVIEGTRNVRRIIDDLSGVDVGDGVQIRRCAAAECEVALTDIRFERISLDDNERAAMVIEAQVHTASGVFCGEVNVGPGGEYGAVVQNNLDPPVGWDTIDRTGSADILDTVGAVDPQFNEGAVNLDDIAGR